MAYRFNPPPNWPIQDQNWTPPPGWQPDPTWGPAPENWNFWVEESETAPAQDADTSVTESAQQSSNTSDTASSSAQDAQGSPMYADASRSDDSELDADATEPFAETAGESDGAHSDDSSHADTAQYEQETVGAATEQASSQYEESDSPEGAQYGSSYPSDSSPSGSVPSAQESGYEHSAGYGAAASYGAASSDYATGSGYAAQGGYADNAYGSASSASSASDPYGNYGSASPAPSWQNGSGFETATGQEPKKGIVARFWWVGCIILVLIVALIAAVAGAFLFFSGSEENGASDRTDAPTTAAPTSAAPTTDPTSAAPTTAAPTSAAPTSAAPSPTGSTPAAVPAVTTDPKPFTVSNGKKGGKVAVQAKWEKPDQIDFPYNHPVQPPTQGDEYLVVRASVTATKADPFANPTRFSVTADGKQVEPATMTYGIASNLTPEGSTGNLKEGETRTFILVFDVKKSPGMKFTFSPIGGDPVSWDVPA